MAEIVAYVKVLKGEVFAKRSDGSSRQLKVGEPVYADEFMVTGKDGYVELAMGNESPFVVPAGETVLVSTDMRSPANHREPAGADEAKVASTSELDDILAKIAAGGDPTELLAATAAGGAAGGGHQFVRLLRLSEALAPFSPDEDAVTTATPDIPFAEGTEEENLAPVVGGAPVSSINTDEDTPFRGQLIASDANGDPLRYLLTSAPAHGVVVLNADGSYDYTPDANYNGSDSFVVTVSDGRGGDTAITIDVSVNPVNDVPVANDVAVTVTEDGSVTGNVVATDVDGDALSYTLQTGAAHGTVTINADGSFQYQPVANYNGNDSFIVTVSDGQGGATNVTVSVTVTPVNDAPVVNPVTLSPVAEDGSIVITAADLLAGASDVDGDRLSISALSLSSGSGLLLSNGDGSWTFTPTADWNGDVSFNFSVTDGSATTNSTASLTVTPVNDAPVVNPVTLSPIAEDGSIVITAADLLAGASDVDAGDTLSISALSLAAGSGTLVDNGDGSWTFTPTADWNGDVAFDFSVTDGTATTNSTASLTVTPVNDAPVVNPVTLSPIAEDGSIVITAADLLAGASDVDAGDTLSISALSLAAGSGTLVDNGDGSWTFTPTADWNGDVAFDFSVTDGTATTNSTASLTVTPVNDAPVVNPVTLSPIAEDGSIVITAADLLAGASDVDAGDTLSISALSLAAGSGTLVDNGDGSWTFTPTADWNGDVAFDFSVTDGTATTNSTASLTVTPVNDAPVVNPVTLSPIAEDGSIVITAADLLAGASDVDAGDTLSISALSLAAGSGTLVDNGDGSWTFTPTADWNGDVAFDFSVTDGTATTNSTASLTVTPVNDAPVVNPVTLSPIAEDGSIVITAADLLAGASDVDAGDTLSISALSLAAGSGTLVDNGDGSWTFTPIADWNGDVSFNFSVTDGTATTNSMASLTVTPINDNAVIGGVDTGVVQEDDPALTVVSGDLTISDVDGSSEESFVATSISNSFGNFSLDAAGHWQFELDNNSADVQALNDGDVSLQTFTINSVDGTSHSINITIQGHNDAAVIGGVSTGSVTEDTVFSASGLLTISDVDNPAEFVAETRTGAFGSLSIDSAGNWTYTLTGNSTAAVQQLGASESLTDTVTVRAVDGTSQVITLTIYGSNDAPVVTPVSLTAIAEDSSITINAAELLAAASDIDSNDTLSISALTLASGSGTLVDNGDGSWTFTPAADWNGDVTFDFSVTDGTVTTSSTASLTVTPVNDAPVVNPVTLTAIDEDSSITITAADLLTGASDVDAGDTLSISALSLASGSGTLVANGDGSWTFTPAADWNGTVSFNFSVTDGSATTDSTASLTVNPVNDAPVVAGPITLSNIPEDGYLLISAADLLAGTSDVDGDALSVVGLSVGSGQGTIVDNGDGTWRFTPNANWHGSVTLNYSVSDGIATVSNYASMSVLSVADAPTVIADTRSGFEDGGAITGNVLSNDSDADGDALRVSHFNVNGVDYLFTASITSRTVTLSGVGSLQFSADGNYRFTPVANWNGNVPTVTYTATDGSLSSSSTLNLTVTPVNDAPGFTGLATAVNYTENPSSSITYATLDTSVAITDIDGQSFAGGSLTVSIANVVAGQDILRVAHQGTGTGQISVVGSNVLYNFGSGAVIIGSITGGSAGSPLVVSLNANATAVAVDALMQRVQYGNSSQLPDTTARIVNIVLNDGGGTANGGTDTVSRSMTINVRSSNDAPTLSSFSGTRSHTEGGTAVVLDNNATISDPELNLLGNYGGSTLTFVRSGGANASDVFSGSGTLAINLGAVTLAGTVVGSYDTAAYASGRLVITFATGVTQAQVNQVLQQVAYSTSSDTPPASVNIQSVFSDGNTGAQGSGGARSSSTGTVLVNITATNDAPIATADNASTNEDTAVTISVLANDRDPDGNPLTVTAASALHGTVVRNPDGTITYTPNANYNGSDTISYTISDGRGGVSSSTVTVDVLATPDAAVIGGDSSGSVSENGAGLAMASGTLTITDADGASEARFQLQDVSDAYGRFTVDSAGNWQFVLDESSSTVQAMNSTDTATRTYTVQSADGTVHTITIDITGANDAAVITGTSTGIVVEDAGANATGSLLSTDVDNSAGFVAETVGGSFGSLTIDSTGNWTYTLTANSSAAVQGLDSGQSLTDEVTVRSIDGTEQRISITIQGQNDAPTAVADRVVTNISAGQNVTIPVSALTYNDVDPDRGEQLAISGTLNVQNGSITAGSDTLTFRNTIATGSSAGQVTESSVLPGDSETNPLNNSLATAYTVDRNQLGLVSSADAASVGNAAQPSWRWYGRIDDVSGMPAGVTDQDYFRIYLRAGEILTLDVDGADNGRTNIGSDPNAVDMLLQVFNASGTLLASNDDAAPTLGGTGSVRSGYHSNSLDSYLQYTANSDGYVYINATAWNNTASGIAQDDGNYQLWLSLQTSVSPYSTGFDYTVTDGNANSTGHVDVQTVTGSTLTGTSAGEILLAGDQADTLNGLAGNDVLLGNGGGDQLRGGSGNDQLTGGSGADVFAWSLGDEGSASAPAQEIVTDYRTSDGDVLDLGALLQGEESGSLESYLHFSSDGSGNTRIEVWSDGDKSHGANQIIDLQGIDLTAGGTLADTDIIQQLVQQGRLRADGYP